MPKQSKSNTVNTWLHNIGASLRRPATGLVALGVLALIASLVGVVAANQPAIAQTVTLATTKQDERFTELYFNHHQDLPKTILANHSTSISYHVTNHEGRTISYHTRISLVENGQVKTIQTTSFTLTDGQGKDMPVLFSASKSDANIMLIIDLPDQNQSIHFRSQS